jgi:hypothetical protein
MSPPKKHVPDDAKNTSVRLTDEDREAIHEIKKIRTAKENGRTRLNDIVVDAIWELLKGETSKTRADIQMQMPPKIAKKPISNVAKMPPPKRTN